MRSPWWIALALVFLFWAAQSPLQELRRKGWNEFFYGTSTNIPLPEKTALRKGSL